MAASYTVSLQEEGRGPVEKRRFKTLAELQQYVRDRWEGVEYMDGPSAWHNDYCLFWIDGATLFDLGQRASDDPDSFDFWIWVWKDLSAQRTKNGGTS